MATGRIHSIESFGSVDGPGVRFVVFFKGCPMRCLYCHNPDTWDSAGATDMTVGEILEQYESKRPFYKDGGLTATGGEPMVQLEFLTELFAEAKSRGIHTCLDTSGAVFRPDDPDYLKKVDALIAVTDLVMLDIKVIDPDFHKRLTGFPLDPVLKFAEYLNDKGVTIWIRHVVVPGLTLDDDLLYRLGRYIGTLRMVKALDILPYHDMAKSKYRKLKIDYPLKDTPPATKEQAIAAQEVVLRGFRESRKSLKKGGDLQ